jgi:hypothetical protein
MRPQTNDGFLSKINKFAPGPGKYEKLDSMSKTGKFPISKFKTYGVPIINPDKGPSDRDINKSNLLSYILLLLSLSLTYLYFILYYIFHHFILYYIYPLIYYIR